MNITSQDLTRAARGQITGVLRSYFAFLPAPIIGVPLQGPGGPALADAAHLPRSCPPVVLHPERCSASRHESCVRLFDMIGAGRKAK